MGQGESTLNAASCTHEIKAEMGMSFFHPGDKITIDSVHCSAPELAVGQLIRVTGRAMVSSTTRPVLLFLGVTATTAASYKSKHTHSVTLSSGVSQFELVHELYAEGFPHLSLYCDGARYGGVYFGKGAWLNKDKPLGLPTSGGAAASSTASIASTVPATPAASDCVYPIDYQEGMSFVAPGDTIEIESVTCTAPTLVKGAFICVVAIVGCSAASQQVEAYLSVTATEGSGTHSSRVTNTQKLESPTPAPIRVTLRHELYAQGWPHLSLYVDGARRGGVYFGLGSWLNTASLSGLPAGASTRTATAAVRPNIDAAPAVPASDVPAPAYQEEEEAPPAYSDT